MPKSVQSIVEQVEHIRLENESLKNRQKELNKIFEKLVKFEFGCSSKRIKKLLNAKVIEDYTSLAKLCKFFGLYNNQDFDNFVEIICNEKTLRFFNARRNTYEGQYSSGDNAGTEE